VNLNELYTQIITENSRSKENRHPVEGATHSLEGVNPSCGDDITLQLRVKDGKIEDAGFIGSGCAISQASASLMIDLVKGRTVEDAHRLISLYFQMIKGKITPEELDDLEDVAALQGSLAGGAAIIRHDGDLVIDAHGLQQLHGSTVVDVVGTGAAHGHGAGVGIDVVNDLLTALVAEVNVKVGH